MIVFYQLYDFVIMAKVLKHSELFPVICPNGFIWQAKICKCYSQIIRDISGWDTVSRCQSLHVYATPVEPYNPAELDVINEMSGKRWDISIN